MSNSGLDFSRPFKPDKIIGCPQMDKAIAFLVSEIEKHENRKRMRTKKQGEKFNWHLKLIISDLFAAWDYHPELYLGISRRRASYQQRVSRYCPVKLSYQTVIDILDSLSNPKLFYIELHKGFTDLRAQRNSRIRASKKLVDLLNVKFDIKPTFKELSNPEIIILKDYKKKLIDYSDTPETLKMRRNLKDINKLLETTSLTLGITKPDLDLLKNRMKLRELGKAKVFDLHKKRLVRIFNNGSFKQGGRFYKGWWMSIPSENRKHILINDNKTAELDFSCFHINMLYHLTGHPSPIGDSYTLDGYNPTIYREVIKKAFYKLLFTPKGKRFSYGELAPLPVGETPKSLVKAIRTKHSKIKKYFRQNYAVKLQYIDSCIAERILLNFVSLKKPILPIHDSFIVLDSDKQLLRSIMQAEYKRVMQYDMEIKEKI